MKREEPIGINYKGWTVTQTTFGKILNLSQPRINQLIDAGVIVKANAKNGAVFLIESLENFFTKKYGTGDLTKEKTLHERAKRELTEIEVAKRRGELYEAGIVENFIIEILTNFRNKFSGFGAKLALQLEGRSRAEINKILNNETDELLNELADALENAEFEEDVNEETVGTAEGDG